MYSPIKEAGKGMKGRPNHGKRGPPKRPLLVHPHACEYWRQRRDGSQTSRSSLLFSLPRVSGVALAEPVTGSARVQSAEVAQLRTAHRPRFPVTTEAFSGGLLPVYALRLTSGSQNGKKASQQGHKKRVVGTWPARGQRLYPLAGSYEQREPWQVMAPQANC